MSVRLLSRLTGQRVRPTTAAEYMLQPEYERRNAVHYASREHRHQVFRELQQLPYSEEVAKFGDALLSMTYHEFAWGRLTAKDAEFAFTTQEAWDEELAKVLADLPTDLQARVDQLGKWATIYQGRSPWITFDHVDKDLTRDLLRNGGDPDDITRELIDEYGEQWLHDLVERRTRENLAALADAAVPLTKPAGRSQAELHAALTEALRSIESSKHLHMYESEPSLRWPELRQDWQNYRAYQADVADGVPESLRRSYNPHHNAITQIAAALGVDSDIIAEAVALSAD